MMHTVLFDIDHTMSAADRRDHLLGNWHAYHSEGANDDPYPEMFALIKALQLSGWRTVAFTARPSPYKAMTLDWLAIHGLVPNEILMRIDLDWRPSADMKLKLFMERFPDPQDWPYIVVLEDHPGVCDVIAKLNVTVLQVHARIKDNPKRNYKWTPFSEKDKET